MDIRKAIATSIEAHKAGNLAAALTGYTRVLRKQPSQPDALHFLGLLRFQQGEHAAGIKLLERSLRVAPDNPHAWNNLGNMRLAMHDAEGARDAYERATAIADGLPEAWYNLGIIARSRRDYDAAVVNFEHAIRTGPSFSRAYEALGMLLYRVQKYAEAGVLYRRWLEHEPGNPIARHMSAAMNGEGGELRASDDYVKRIFDGFAAHFDARLEALGYRAPQLLVAALGDFTDMQSGRLDILDAGCGTGLCGALLRSSAHRLDGVDLSEGMIEKARERGLYDSLSVAELCAYMRQRTPCFDLVLSADTLCYFGDLEEPLEAAHGCLRQNGLIAFTVEAAADNDPAGYRLLHHGRYAHRAGYLDDVMRRAGLTVLARESVVLRKERDADVAGHLCIAQRPKM